MERTLADLTSDQPQGRVPLSDLGLPGQIAAFGTLSPAEEAEQPPNQFARFLAGAAKHIYSTLRTLGEAGAGNIPFYDEYGRINREIIGASADAAWSEGSALAPLEAARLALEGSLVSKPLGAGKG